MITERDAQEAERAMHAIATAASEIEDLIDRARQKNWMIRVGTLRAMLATLHRMEHDFEGLFR